VHGTPITWGLLSSTSGHGSAFFTGASGDVTARLRVTFPTVKYPFSCSARLDESYAAQLIHVGPTVGFNTADFHISTVRNVGVRLTGAGTNTWTKNGDSGAFDVSTFNTADGGTSLNVQAPALTSDQNLYNRLVAVYHGPNGYTIDRAFSGLGAYNYRFILRKPDLSALNTNPTTSDHVVLRGPVQPLQIGALNWSATTNSWITGGTNFFVDGLFEAWMVVHRLTAASNLVRWQTDYPSATTYRIYRATLENLSDKVLVHTGTEGYFEDTGLAAGTMYVYQMVAMISGVETAVTTFRCKTYAI
jgi:hypothetical protein